MNRLLHLVLVSALAVSFVGVVPAWAGKDNDTLI